MLQEKHHATNGMDGQEGRGYMRKLCGMSLLILALLFPFPVFAAGQEKVMGNGSVPVYGGSVFGWTDDGAGV